MKNLLIVLGLIVVGCGLGAPSKTDITCQKGYGTCYVVHCENRKFAECQKYYFNFCPKGWLDRSYGVVDARNGQYDRLLECQ